MGKKEEIGEIIFLHFRAQIYVKGLLHSFGTKKVTSEKKFRSCTSHASDSPCNLKPDFKQLGEGEKVFPLYRILKFSIKKKKADCICNTKKMLMFTEQKVKGRTTQEPTQPCNVSST